MTVGDIVAILSGKELGSKYLIESMEMFDLSSG